MSVNFSTGAGSGRSGNWPAGSVISGLAQQPGAEGQHQDAGAEHQQRRAGGDRKTHHGFEGGHDQGHHNHLGEFLFEAVERSDVEQIAAEFGLFPMAWVDVGDHKFVDAVAKDQQRNSDQVVVDSADHFSDQQSAVVVGEMALQHLAQHAQFRVGANGKTADTAEQAHHNRHQGDQAEFPDQRLKATFHAGGPMGRPAHDGLIVEGFSV